MGDIVHALPALAEDIGHLVGDRQHCQRRDHMPVTHLDVERLDGPAVHLHGVEDLGQLQKLREVGQGFVVRQADRADLCANARGHLPDPVAEYPGSDRQHPVAGQKATLQAAPQGHHSFPEEDDHAAAGLEDALEVCLGSGVKLDVLCFEIGGAVVHPVSLQHGRMDLHGSRDHGDGIGFHDQPLALRVLATKRTTLGWKQLPIRFGGSTVGVSVGNRYSLFNREP